MTVYKDARGKDQLNLQIPRSKLKTFPFASMSTACWLAELF